MNPLIVETAIQTALSANAFPSTTIYTATGYQELTPESLNIIVAVDQLEHVVGTLYKAHVTFKLEAPALLGSSSLSQLSSAIETLRGTVLNNSYFGSYWPSGSAAVYSGIFVQETTMAQQEHAWVAEIKALIGIQE